jgi:hypothetical protein
MGFDERNQKPAPAKMFRRQRALLFGTIALLAASAGCDSSSDGGGAGTGANAGAGGSGASGKGGSGGTSGKGGSGAVGGGAGGTSGAAGSCSATAGGPVTASAADKHCIVAGVETKQETNESACMPADPGPPPEADDAGAMSEFGDTLNGTEGDDDDCKYHLKWTASCIEQNKDVTFMVTVTKKSDGTPLTKALPDLEVFLSDTHNAPNTKQVPKETAPGVYTAGPIRFDASGKWTVRFHLREECVDLTEDSPHGHIAFYVNVP